MLKGSINYNDTRREGDDQTGASVAVKRKPATCTCLSMTALNNITAEFACRSMRCLFMTTVRAT